jgi:hypothetical protein
LHDSLGAASPYVTRSRRRVRRPRVENEDVSAQVEAPLCPVGQGARPSACGRGIKPMSTNGTSIPRQLTCGAAIPSSREALKGLSLSFFFGAQIGVVKGNGAGKSPRR